MSAFNFAFGFWFCFGLFLAEYGRLPPFPPFTCFPDFLLYFSGISSMRSIAHIWADFFF